MILVLLVGLVYWGRRDRISEVVGYLHEPRSSHFAVELNDHRILFIGGARLKSAETYDPNDKRWWSGMFHLPVGNRGPSSDLVPTVVVPLKSLNKIFVSDGQRLELYDVGKDTFESVSGKPSFDFRYFATATALDDGRVLIIGGTNAQQNTEIFDPHTKAFLGSFELVQRREVHTATRLKRGGVLVSYWWF